MNIDDRAEGINLGSNGIALSRKGPCRDAATVVFTPEQINDYCKKVLNLHLSSRNEGKLLFDGVQIIKQLQSRTDLNHILGCDCMSMSGCCGVLQHIGMDVICNECGQKFDVEPVKQLQEASNG